MSKSMQIVCLDIRVHLSVAFTRLVLVGSGEPSVTLELRALERCDQLTERTVAQWVVLGHVEVVERDLGQDVVQLARVGGCVADASVKLFASPLLDVGNWNQLLL